MALFLSPEREARTSSPAQDTHPASSARMTPTSGGVAARRTGRARFAREIYDLVVYDRASLHLPRDPPVRPDVP